MRRGELWTYEPQGSPRHQLVVIVSSNGVNDSGRRWLLGVPITVDDPHDILAVPITRHGWADVTRMTRYFRLWLTKSEGVAGPADLEQLDSALRAVLDL